MTNAALIGPWIRRFLLEYLVGERNLSINTQRSYRDMLLQLLPFVATQTRKPIERLTVSDVSATRIRLFLNQLELTRHCSPMLAAPRTTVESAALKTVSRAGPV